GAVARGQVSALASPSSARGFARGRRVSMHPLVGLHLSGNALTSLDEGAMGGQLGRPVWNPRQLLTDLELRLGLPHPEVSRGVRVQEWSKRLAARCADPSRPAPFYAAAYAVDPTGTAAQL